jgi:hypothetical protein
MRRWLVLWVLGWGVACGSGDDDSGAGGAAGAGGSSGGGGVAAGGAPSDAGCVDVPACTACLESSCAAELGACKAVPACSEADFDRTSCLETCVSAQNCWSVQVTSAGTKAEALRTCAKTSCTLCQP